MHVVFLNPVGGLGGGERVLLTAVRSTLARFPEARVSVVLLGDGPLRNALEALGAEVHLLPLPTALAGLGDTQFRKSGRLLALLQTAAIAPRAIPFLHRLRRLLRTLQPSFIHSNGLKTHALTAFVRPPGVPVLWHLHDFLSDRPVMAKVLARLRRRVVAGIAIAPAVQRDAAGILPGLSIPIVLNAVDTDHFTPGPGDGESLDRLAGLPPLPSGAVRVGLVATYANWKGQDVFLDAIARVPNVRGLIVGGPIYATAGSQFTRESLEHRAESLGLTGRVGFVPFQNDPLAVYRALDVVVHASTRPEPFGLTIAEAMSCGRPVVVSAAGGAADLFTEGHDGLGHPPGDSESLSAAIARLCRDTDLRTRLGRAARTSAVARFGLERYANELAAVYAGILPLASNSG